MPMRVDDYEAVTLQVQHEYSRELLKDRKTALRAIAQMRTEMVRQIAEQIYDAMEFNDYENPETWNIIMRGRIRILRRDT